MDNLIKKILIPIDGSETATKALNYALNLAEMCKAEVEIISVIPPVESVMPRFTLTAPQKIYTRFLEEVEKRIRTVLAEASKIAKRKKIKKVATRLLHGRPADEIVQAAQKEGFDLIVIGSRGLGGAKEWILGSVSSKVSDLAPCPVLIIK